MMDSSSCSYYHHCDYDASVSVIKAMRKQEETTYRPIQYLVVQNCDTYNSYNNNDCCYYYKYNNNNNNNNNNNCTKQRITDCTYSPWNIEARFRMVEWSYKFADILRLKRSTVAVAISCFDRFLNTPAGHQALMDPCLFQLSCVASLYSTIKTLEVQAVAPKYFASLGGFSVQDIERMELYVLNALEWRLNPPTALSFCQEFLNLLPDLSTTTRDAILELAKFQTELAIYDHSFCAVPASSIALAALLNGLESVLMDPKLVYRAQSIMFPIAGIVHPLAIRGLQARLFEAVSQQQQQPQGCDMTLAAPTDSTCSAAAAATTNGQYYCYNTLQPMFGTPLQISNPQSTKIIMASPRCVSSANNTATTTSTTITPPKRPTAANSFA